MTTGTLSLTAVSAHVTTAPSPPPQPQYIDETGSIGAVPMPTVASRPVAPRGITVVPQTDTAYRSMRQAIRYPRCWCWSRVCRMGREGEGGLYLVFVVCETYEDRVRR